MLQTTATKSPLTVVPGYSRLFRCGATYYFRVGEPMGLRKAIGKTEIIKSLRTTELRKAKSLCDLEQQAITPLLKRCKTFQVKKWPLVEGTKITGKMTASLIWMPSCKARDGIPIPVMS